MTTLGSDVRLAVRTLRRRPVFTLLAILTLTIGVGANAAVFRLIDALFLQPLPLVREPERLVEISGNAGREVADVSYGFFGAMRAERGVLADAAAYTMVPVSLTSVADVAPSVHMALSVTGNYFDVLGVRPAMGRFFAPEESFYPSVAPVVVISDQIWREQLAADPGVVGRSVRINGVSLVIVGVAPADFHGHSAGLPTGVYIPVGVAVPGLPTPSSLDEARSAALAIIARLRPGVSVDAARSALGAAATRYLEADSPPIRRPRRGCLEYAWMRFHPCHSLSAMAWPRSSPFSSRSRVCC